MLLGEGFYCVCKTVEGQEYYIGVVDGKLTWATDRQQRLSLSREEDAEAIQSLFPDAQFIIELSIG